MSKITSLVLLLISFTGFSQQLISGKVKFQEIYQKNIDVINYTNKKATKTNELGQFSIEAKVNDVLVFMSEDFVDQKYKLSAEDFETKSLIIKLAERPIPLEEVEITQVKAIKMAAVSYNDAKIAKIQNEAGKPQVLNVYTGEIPNGTDLVQVGKMIGKLFKSKKPKNLKAEPISFSDYAKANFNQSFFTKTLKIKPEDTSRFIEFCNKDPKAKEVIKNNDELAILEFLMAKKTEFDKLD